MIDSTRAFAKLVAAFNQNDWPRVQQRATALLGIAPDDARLHFMLGVAAMQIGALDDALAHLRTATHREPRRADYVAQYAKALALVRRTRDARLVADRAMTLAPGDAMAFDTLGIVYAQANATVQSANAFRRAAALLPDHAPARFNLARALQALGDIDGAGAELAACVRLAPTAWHAWLALARLRPQTATGNQLAPMRELLAAHADDPAAQILLNMALGKTLEDLTDYPHAFQHFVRGKAAARRQRPYDSSHDKAMFEAITRAFPATRPTPEGRGNGPSPIFVVGLPYTGIHAVERLLAAHPDVYAASVTPNFPALLQRLAGSPQPLLREADLAARVRHIDWPRLGGDYLARLRAITGDAPRTVDSLPDNLLHVGFIARALPNARIIAMRRDPVATCLDNFRQLTELNPRWHDYSFDLMDIGRYQIEADQLLAHWRRCLPGRILEISCEALRADPETTTRELLAFCDLPWHAACLQPRPDPFPDPLSPPDHWRHYAAELRDLRWLLAGAEQQLARS